MVKKTLPGLVNFQQAAELLGSSRQAVSKALKNGRLTAAVKLGRTILISRASVIAYKKSRRPGGPPPKKRPRKS